MFLLKIIKDFFYPLIASYALVSWMVSKSKSRVVHQNPVLLMVEERTYQDSPSHTIAGFNHFRPIRLDSGDYI